jgi:hypothetical protein
LDVFGFHAVLGIVQHAIRGAQAARGRRVGIYHNLQYGRGSCARILLQACGGLRDRRAARLSVRGIEFRYLQPSQERGDSGSSGAAWLSPGRKLQLVSLFLFLLRLSRISAIVSLEASGGGSRIARELRDGARDLHRPLRQCSGWGLGESASNFAILRAMLFICVEGMESYDLKS